MCFPLNITKSFRNLFLQKCVLESLVWDSDIPRYCHIYNYCYLLHFFDNNNIWFLSKIIISMTLYIHVPNKFVVDIFGNHMRMCRYHFSDFSRLNFLHNFQWTLLETMPCLGFVFSLGYFWAFTHDMANCFTCLTKHSTRSWINTYKCGIWHSLFFLLLVLVQGVSGPVVVFLNHIFSSRARAFLYLYLESYL